MVRERRRDAIQSHTNVNANKEEWMRHATRPVEVNVKPDDGGEKAAVRMAAASMAAYSEYRPTAG